ncbi:MAG: hypothetical protein ACD_73C00034G0002, partial [uncultured bacterium]
MAIVNKNLIKLPDRNEPAKSLPKPETQVPKPEIKQHLDQAKSREMARLPSDIGHQIAGRRVLNQPLPQAFVARGRLHLSPDMREGLAKAFQGLLRDPILRQKRGSDFAEFIERRFVALSRDGSQHGLQKIPVDVLNRLFKMRHQVEDKSQLFLVMRYEIGKLKDERKLEKERVSDAKEAKGENAKEGTDGASAKGAKGSLLEKEAFLRRSSHVLKNLNADESESTFESLLKKVLSGAETTSDLGSGKKANYKGKSEEGWKEFFKNVLNQGSHESLSTHKADSILEAFYRGLYKNLSSQKGMTLVTDIKLAAGDKEMQEKFVRIAVENPELLDKLSNLKPGEDLPKELIKLLGDNIEYTKLVNKAELLASQTGEQLLQQLRQSFNPNVMNRLEQQLL